MIKRLATLFSICILITSVSRAQAPTTQASAITIAPISGSTTSMRLAWTNGNGNGRLVVIKNATGNFTPTNGATPSGINNDLSLATDQDASTGGVAKVVANSGTTVDVLGLAENALYYIQIYEWNTNVPNPTYSLVTSSTNPIAFQFYTTAGSHSFTTPVDVSSLNIQVWGSGAGGGNSNNTSGGAGGGGGGGAYSTSPTFGVSTNTGYNLSIGAGGDGAPASSTTDAENGEESWFSVNGAAGVVARGGARGLDNASVGTGAGAGGDFSLGFGTTRRSGGNGAPTQLTTGDYGGGGGTSAGTGANGNTGSTNSDGSMATAPAGGGNGGGAGSGANSGNGGNGGFPGGGGGGSDDAATNFGGNGANGLVIVAFNDNTSPTATITRLTPTAAYIRSTTTSVTFQVTFNENVNRVDVTDFVLAGTAVGTSVVNAVNPVSESVYNVVITSTGTGNGTLDLNFAGGQNIVDIANNAFGGSTSGDEIYNIDNTAPTGFTTGNILTVGGNIVGGFYNNTNTGITIEVPIANDASLVNGTIQIQIDKDGGASFANLGSPVTIGSAPATQTVNISDAQLIAVAAEFVEGSTLTFTAIITDLAGNTTTGTSSATTVVRSETAPTTPSVPDLDPSSDSGNNSDNVTSDNTPTFNVTGAAGILLEVLEGSNIIASTATATGSLQALTSSTLSDGSSYSITARVTNAAGSVATSAAMTPVLQIDTAPPAAPTGLDLTTDSGLSATDNITNDNTPSFNITGTSSLLLEILDGTTVVASAASATGSSQSLTTSTLTNATHSITARTTDLAGNTTSSGALSVTIDNVAPSVSSITPAALSSRGFLPMTGTITAGTGSPNVTGVGTAFTTELFPGAVIRNAANTQTIGTVLSITSDTQLTLTGNASNAISAAGYSIRLYFTVTFDGDMDVSTVTTGDFTKGLGTASGTAISAIGPVTVLAGPPITSDVKSTSFRVSVDASGNGTWRLDKNNNSYSDVAGNSSTTTANGTVANIDNTAPTVTSIVRKTPTAAYTHATTVTYTVTFAEDVTGVDAADFTKTITGGGFTAGAITVNPVSASVYDVDIASIATVDGTLRLDVPGSATIIDAAGNAFTAAFTTGEVYTFDYTNPTAFSTGNVISSGGRVRPYYYNLTNTGIDVVVPIANDASLNGGSVQLQARLLPAGTFANVGSASTISAVNTNKTVSLLAADLAGYLANGNNIEFTARITDLAGNGPITGTAGTVTITVDLVRPTIVVAPRVYDNKGGGPNNSGATNNHEVIQFTVNEELYNSATVGNITCTTGSANVTGVGTNFTKLVVGGVITNSANVTIGTIQSITSDVSLTLTGNAGVNVTANTFKFRGMSALLGLTTSTGTIGSTQYINDATTNTVDGTLNNTRLIYVESSANSSGWTTTTNLSYTQSAGGSTTGNYLYDAAGNEMNTFSLTCTSGDITPPALSPDVMTLYPRAGNPEKIVFTLSEALSTSTTPGAVTGFSTSGIYPDLTIADATYSEASPGVCPCTITLTSLLHNNWNIGTQVSYSQLFGNVLDLAGSPNELGNISNHALVMETTPPSITAVSIPNVAMKVGSVVTATITTVNDDGDDASYTSGTIGGFNLSGGTIVNSTPTSKTIQFTVAEGGTDVAAASSIPVTNIILTDGQGNASTPFSASITQANDPIDAHSPTISSVTNSVATIYEGALAQTVTVVYSETMLNTIQPTISLSTGNAHWTQAPSGGTNGWVGNTYTATLTHDTFEEELSPVSSSVAVGGAQDAAGNPNLGTASSTTTPFTLDTKKPTVTVGVSPSTINVANTTLTVTVDYNEAMNVSTTPVISFNIGTGVSNFSPVAAGVWSNGNKRYTRSYQQLNNLTSLTNSVTVTTGSDVAGNTQLSAGSGNFVIDTQSPTVSSVNRVGSQFTNATTVYYNVTFSEAVSGLALTDFTPFVVLNNPSVNAGVVNSISTSDNIHYTVEVTSISGDGNIRLDVNTSGSIIDSRNNPLPSSFTGGQIYTIDNTPALVSSITIASTVNPWSVANGLPIHPNDSASFQVIFSEPVTGVDATDFIITNTVPSRLSIAGPVVITGSGTTWNVKLKGINLTSTTATVQFKIDLVDDNTILDLAGLPLGGAAAGDGNFTTASLPSSLPTVPTYYSAVFPEPVDIASNFMLTGTTNSSFSFQFNSPAAPSSRISHFVVQVKKSTVASFIDPVDGVYPSGVNDSDFSDGRVGVLIANPSNGALISFNTTSLGASLTSGFSYNVRILSVSYSGLLNTQQQLDYLTSVSLPGIGNTTTASAGTVSNSFTAPSISSTVTSTSGVPVYTFTLNEDGTGATKTLDDAPTKFSRLIFTPGGTNNISDWTTAIAGAQLTDLEGNIISGLDVSIAATSITFNNIPSSNNTQMGFLDDDENKQFTLRIWLHPTLGVSDNSRLDFRVDNSSFPIFDDLSNSQVSSKLASTSTESGTVKVDIYATKLVFVTNPQPNIGVGINFNQSTQPQPRIEARDANNNLDLDYNAAFTVSPSTGVVTSLTNFSSGVLTLSAFNFSTQGPRTITISGNAVATPIAYPALTGAGVQAVSTSVDAKISNKTTIFEATAPSAERDFIPSTTTATPSFFNFDFTITDDVGVDLTDHVDDDALPTLVQTITITRGANNGVNATPGPDTDATTFDEWTRSIAGAQLKAVGNTQTVNGIVSNGSILFNIPAGTFMESVPNNGSLTYELRIWLQNPVDAALRDIIDNKDFSFAINQSNIGVGAANTTSTLANSSASTGDGRNVVTVTATQLDFVTQWAAGAAQNYDAALSPNPVAKARDANQNLDTDWSVANGKSASVLTATPATYPLANSAVTLTNGIMTFNAGLQVTSAGNGANGATTNLVLTSTGLTNGISNTFTLNYSGNSTITRDESFVHPTDIQTINNREAANLTVANSIALDRFLMSDGGGSNDADGTKTKLQSITLNLTNYLNIRRIALYDESGVEIKELDSTAFAATGNITFTSFANAFEANDDDHTSKLLTVRVSFRAFVSDNQMINVSVIAASAAGVSSQLVPTTIPGDDLITGGDKNKVEVVATRIDFTTIPTTASISVPLSPQVVVSARDAYANLDADYNGPITEVETNPISDLLFHTLNNPSGSFSSGQFTYPAAFQFDIGDGSVKLTIKADPGTGANNINAAAITGESATINVISSFESGIKSTFYTPPTPISVFDINNYINYQGIDITGLSDGYTLDQLVLNDGSQDGTPGDADGANTVLANLTLGISNPQSIKRIAIYQQDNITLAWSEVQEKLNGDILVTNGYGQLPFTGLNITALDNGVKNIRVLATFFSSSAAIQDNDSIQVSILSATTGTGSKFYPDGTTNTTIGGVAKSNLAFPPAATSISAGSRGPYQKIEVLATKFDFIQQPPAYAGIHQPVPLTGSPIQVHARDPLNNLDVDFNYASNNTLYGVSVTAPNPTLPFSYSGSTFAFVNGVLTMPDLEYRNPGDGTLTITSTNNAAVNSNVNNTSIIPNNVAVKCTPVRVMHTTANLATGGVVTGNNLRGGTTNTVIFGVTFMPSNAEAGVQPKLKQFTFSFDKAYRTGPSNATLRNFRVFESTTGTYTTGTPNVALLNAVVTEGKSALLANPNHRDLVTVTFNPGFHRDLSSTTYSYFLMCDVDNSANAGTPSLQPQLISGGYHSVTYTNIQVTEGSAASNVVGTSFSFASTKPPKIVFSNPANGQLNVDPNQSTLQLTFDVPVFTHDHKAYLYDSLNNKIADLIATNGRYGIDATTTGGNNSVPPTPPLTFTIPGGILDPNSVYYILIEKAVIDTQNPANSRGIADDLSNLFGGITYPGGLRFKTANPNPPKMLSTDAGKYYISANGGSVNASFNQRGKAYFLVTNVGGAVPTTAMIKGAVTYSGGTLYGRDTIIVNQINTLQYGSFSAVTPLAQSTNYAVWMYAENDALPTPVAVTHPFLSVANSYAVNTLSTSEPTFTISFSAPSGNLTFNSPVYQICSNSHITLSAPIIIEEGTPGQFYNAQIQSFNILLPEGYQFDKTVTPVIETFGEFTGKAKPSFINNTVLKIEFQNYGTSTIDKIAISNMSVFGDPTAPNAYIKRLGGNAIPALDDDDILATIGIVDEGLGSFTNSYSTLNNFTSIGITNAVTVIPDNFSDPSLTAANSVRLIPTIAGDYGPNVFTGSGVTNEVLSLNGVALNTSFDITLTHTDMNGCVSAVSEQYQVYDHTKAIPGLPTKQGIANTDFPNYAPSYYPADSITFRTVAGYLLDTLFASIPARIQPGRQIIDKTTTWFNIVSDIPQWNPVERDTSANPILGGKYHNYALDYKSILNDSIDAGPGVLTKQAYNWFKDRTLEGRTFWKGGSMGVIEFTGIYQSIADRDIRIPLRQEVEIFLPPVPVVEIANTEISGYDNTDALRPDTQLWPLGTPIFCEAGNDILITGYPRAVQGQSTGSFQIVNAADSSALTYPVGAFVDNGNGTAILKPGSLTNNYEDMLILYRFKDNISPIDSVGSLVIRVSPNPIASFSITSLLDSANALSVGRPSAPDAYCVNNLIEFRNTSDANFPASSHTYTANRDQNWEMGDPNSINTTYKNLQTLADSALFIYTATNKYTVKFSVSSQYGCPSPVASDVVYIGAIPLATFSMNGISTATAVNVVDDSTVPDAPGVDSEIYLAEWVYSPELTDTVLIDSYTFAVPGHHTITLVSTTEITNTDDNITLSGCQKSVERPVIIVPFVTVPLTPGYVVDDFEDSDPLKQWQSSSPNAAISSWVRGNPNNTESSAAKFVETPRFLSTNNVWTTGLNQAYNTGEISFLYSPAYDFENLIRPKVGFDQVAYMGQNDGVALEFSMDTFNIADPLKKWYRVGSTSNGNNWYNKPGLASSPGDQTDYASQITAGDFGWSSQLDTVLHSQHTLSPDIPDGKRSHVIFRFALASTLLSSQQGFSLDNFRVGERTRLVLVENFTNLGNTLMIGGENVEHRESEYLNDVDFPVVGTDVVKLNYHVSFPSLDPFNDDYPADPSARALYYSINETPQARMDGSRPADPEKKYFSSWGLENYNVRTLMLAEAEINITGITTTATGGFQFNVEVSANADLPGDTTILHVAFVEASTPIGALSAADQTMVKTGENSFEYIVKAMLPNALGTKFQTKLPAASAPRVFGPFEWTPDLGKLYGNNNDLAIVAFLQNEFTHEIYQATISSLQTDPSVVTGVEDPDYASKINFYPNPANEEVNVQLPAAAIRTLPVQLIDTYGRVMYDEAFKPGEQVKKFKTTELAGGVYFIQIETPDGELVRRKIMVVHR